MKILLLILAIGYFATQCAVADLNDMVSNDGMLPTLIEPTNKIERGNTGTARFNRSLSELGGSSVELTPSMAAQLNALASLDSNETSKSKAAFGIDTRSRIFTTTYPMRAVVLITVQTSQVEGKCTGWLINSNTVITAGHCVHQGQNGSWYPVEGYTIYPAYDGANAPYGKCTAKRLYSTIGWTTNSNREYDYAALKLNCAIGKITGWFGFGTYETIKGFPTIISGYPGEKIGLWGAADIVSQETSTRAYYKTDTSSGMSGSPVWYDANSGPLAIAIHTSQSGSLNGGTRINKNVFTNLKNWKLAE